MTRPVSFNHLQLPLVSVAEFPLSLFVSIRNANGELEVAPLLASWFTWSQLGQSAQQESLAAGVSIDNEESAYAYAIAVYNEHLEQIKALDGPVPLEMWRALERVLKHLSPADSLRQATLALIRPFISQLEAKA